MQMKSANMHGQIRSKRRLRIVSRAFRMAAVPGVRKAVLSRSRVARCQYDPVQPSHSVPLDMSRPPHAYRHDVRAHPKQALIGLGRDQACQHESVRVWRGATLRMRVSAGSTRKRYATATRAGLAMVTVRRATVPTHVGAKTSEGGSRRTAARWAVPIRAISTPSVVLAFSRKRAVCAHSSGAPGSTVGATPRVALSGPVGRSRQTAHTDQG